MKIAYVTMRFPAPSEAFAGTDVRVLRSLGNEVDVYTMLGAHRRHGQLIHERGLDGVRVCTMTAPRALRGLGRSLLPTPLILRWWAWFLARTWRRPVHLLKSLALVPAAVVIAEDVRREAYDVVHLFWGHFPSLAGGLVLLQRPSPMLSMFLGAYDMQAGYGPSNDLARLLDVVFTHAGVNVQTLMARGIHGDRIRLVYRGVPPEVAEVARSLADTGQVGPRSGLRIVTACRLIASKRTQDVIEAFAMVVRQRPDAVLTVLGEGPERETLRSRVAALGLADRVEFRGHRDQATVFQEMAHAQAFVLLSVKEDERLPNVVKEAMAHGCVPVVTGTAGIDELVEEGVHGFVVPPLRPDLAAERIERILQGGPDIETMRLEGLRRIAERFDARVSMSAYVEAWAGGPKA